MTKQYAIAMRDKSGDTLSVIYNGNVIKGARAKGQKWCKENGVYGVELWYQDKIDNVFIFRVIDPYMQFGKVYE